MNNLAIPLFEVANTDQLSGYQLQFAKEGYIIIKGLIETDLIDELAHWTKSFFTNSSTNLKADVVGKNNRIQDAALFEDLVRNLACDEKIINILEEVYERKPIPFQTLNFYKGTEQKTHSDSIHFNTTPQRWMCGVWVAFEEVNQDNGPLHYYPGSHRLPILDASDTNSILINKNEGSYSKYCSNYEPAIQELIKISGLKKEIFFPQKGDCLIWSSNLLHGGEPILNKSSTRLSQVTHYFFEGCAYSSPIHSNPKKSKTIWKNPIHNFCDPDLNNKDNPLISKKYLIKHNIKSKLQLIKNKIGI